MIQFIKDALAELEHVVWPTPKETRKYVTYVIGVIVALGVFLAVLGYIITTALGWSREKVQEAYPAPAIQTPTVSGEEGMTEADVQELLKQIQANTGTTVSGSTHSGITLPVMTGSGQ